MKIKSESGGIGRRFGRVSTRGKQAKLGLRKKTTNTIVGTLRRVLAYRVLKSMTKNPIQGANPCLSDLVVNK